MLLTDAEIGNMGDVSRGLAETKFDEKFVITSYLSIIKRGIKNC